MYIEACISLKPCGDVSFMAKKKNKAPLSLFFRRLAKKIRANAQLLILLLVVFAVLTVCTGASYLSEYGVTRVDLNDFEVGAVADRDVTLQHDLSYIDEEATAIRREARMNLVTAVFEYLQDSGSRSRWQTYFFDFLRAMEEASMSASQPRVTALEVQEKYPGAVDASTLEEFFSLPEASRTEALRFASYFFNSVVTRGLTSFPDEGMENFSRTEVEVIRGGEHITQEMSALLTRETLPAFLDSEAQAAGLAEEIKPYISALVFPFLRENLIFQSYESELKMSIALESVTPVLVVIPQGEKIVRRGFVVTEESYAQLEHLAESGSAINMTRFAATELLLLTAIILAVFVLFTVSCKNLRLLRYRIFLSSLFCIVYGLGLIYTHIHLMQNPLNFMVATPAALFCMLATILLSKQSAISLAFALASAVFISSGFSPEPMIFALFSGIAAVGVIRDTGHRLDLVRSAALMLVLCAAFSFVICIAYPAPSAQVPFYVTLAGLNGFLSGILVIGLLPLLERMLNAVTSFRLMELSDLNTPLMQKMLITVPGTYNHSQMVASLAEDACRAIGANALLARVGAFYHDIGKMDQGEYFVENQHGENKHDELSPRISATIIRSHVKQGVEKARNLKLPQEVIDIIAEHHGNSVIAFFYNKAKMENPDVSVEDFMYPGNPPRTRESAVVMIADTVEAACRTLEKPTMARLSKFIDELVKGKIEHGQLENCDLTFHDLDTIKKSFVNLLVGHYHSRIEYPDQKDPDAKDKAQGKPAANASSKEEAKGEKSASDEKDAGTAKKTRRRAAGKEATERRTRARRKKADSASDDGSEEKSET